MNKLGNVSVIVPVYNEERAIFEVLKEIKEVVSTLKNKHEIIAVDDGSTDNSLKILQGIKGIKIVRHPYNKGYGAAIKTGIMASQYEWIIIVDGDGTYPVKDIPRLLQYIEQYDMVVGARTGKSVAVPLLRRPAKFLLTTMANFLAERKIPDLNSGFRVFRRRIALEYFHLIPSGFSFTTTITLACLTNEYTVKYVPINYYKRKGKSTIHPFNDFINFTTIIVRIIMYFKPLRFFLVPTFMLIVIGLFCGLYTLILYRNITDVSILFILMGIQLAFIGLLADLIAKTRR
jgi:glycosyltransferase involved in cell wall biosynthesis